MALLRLAGLTISGISTLPKIAVGWSDSCCCGFAGWNAGAFGLNTGPVAEKLKSDFGSAGNPEGLNSGAATLNVLDDLLRL
jgi:hypothetical protein